MVNSNGAPEAVPLIIDGTAKEAVLSTDSATEAVLQTTAGVEDAALTPPPPIHPLPHYFTTATRI